MGHAWWYIGLPMHVVWKFKLGTGEQVIKMPKGSRILYPAEQHEEFVLYVLVPHPDPPEPELRHIYVCGTGEPFDATHYEPLGLIKMAHGALMFHVFERKTIER